ncbi:hypothetical protein V8G54_035951 [Vigna mungo]|uniref:SWIM-type domain-containing protein n=1 Tax=Vigna mungo TaxID=3915 RepID=A0AAQ3MG86_VIGMU
MSYSGVVCPPVVSHLEIIFVSPIMYRLKKKVLDMDDERIKIVVHHSGHFVNDDNGDSKFDGEIAEWFCDADFMSYFGIVASVKELGHMNVKELWYGLGGQSVHPDRLELLTDDKGAMQMLNIGRLNDEVHLYVVHNMVEPQIIEMIEWVGSEAADEGVEVHTEGDAQEGHGVDVEVHAEGHAQEGGKVHVEDAEVHVDDGVVQVEGADVQVEDGYVQEVEDGEVQEVEDGEVQVEDGEFQNGEVWEVEVADVRLEDGEVQDVYDFEVKDFEVDDFEEEDFEIEDLGEDDDDVEDSEGEDIKADSEGKDIEADSEEKYLHDVTVQCDIGTSKVRDEHSSPLLESSQSIDNDINMHDVRGLSDNEWLSDDLMSGSESENNDGSSKTIFPTFKMPRSLEAYKWDVGTFFAEKNEFIDAIRTYALSNGRNLKFIKNDKKRISAKCMGGNGNCKWYAYCAFMIDVNAWQLRKVLDTHSCSRDFNVKLMTSKWLSQRMEKFVRENPTMKVMDIRDKVTRKWNVGISRNMAFRARAMAKDNIEGSFIEQYRRLHDYGHELLKTNPGTTVQIKVENINGEVIFHKFYACLKACKDSFLSCRPIIGLDGCFLKSKYGGELLTAVGRDGNEQMLPIAYAVVEGLLAAFEDVLPRVEQRFCVRHLAAIATHPQEWETKMRNIKAINLEAFKYLISIPPISRFTSRSKCDTLVNNMCEAFNSVLVDSRSKPIISMLEDIRVYIMNRWAANRKKMTQYQATICPKVWNRFQKESWLGRYWLPRWSGDKLFEVIHISQFGHQFVVNVDTMECTCRKWAITGIPCTHAITAMKFLNINAEHYIDHWFRKSTYEETYNGIIYPINGQHIWEVTPYSDILPPKKKTMPGRPKKKRRLKQWELKKNDFELRKGGQRKRCTICKELGHNKKGCPQRPTAQSATEQTQATQAAPNDVPITQESIVLSTVMNDE